jgi:sugar O-acyltransferase (sialic acid O-acetyltransferase NeuD family)
MAQPSPVTIPLINPNEPAALLAAIHVVPGQHISPGDKLCTLETTKSTLELVAESSGYIVGLRTEMGETVQAGDIFCYIAESKDWNPPELDSATSTPVALPVGIRISQPALLLAQKHNLDLAQFTGDAFITERMVQELVDASTQVKAMLEVNAYEPNSIFIYGGGGHGKALIDLIRLIGIYPIVGIVDDGITPGSSIMGVPVLGGSSVLEHLYECGVRLAANAVGGIGNIAIRINVFDRLAQVGFNCPTLLHPTAFIEQSATLAAGVQVMPHAYVGSEAQVGFGVIINTSAIVSHDCILGDYVNLSPGAILAGEVNVERASLIGMGVTVNLRVKIGERARVGNGATVKSDVPAAGIVHAGTVWPLDRNG